MNRGESIGVGTNGKGALGVSCAGLRLLACKTCLNSMLTVDCCKSPEFLRAQVFLLNDFGSVRQREDRGGLSQISLVYLLNDLELLLQQVLPMGLFDLLFHLRT